MKLNLIFYHLLLVLFVFKDIFVYHKVSGIFILCFDIWLYPWNYQHNQDTEHKACL